MLTPFTAGGRLDAPPPAERLFDLNRLHVFVLGTTGEGASVPRSNQQRLVDLALRTAAKRVRVYAVIITNSLADSIAAGREYLQAGADAVVAHSPMDFHLNDAEITAWFTQLVGELRGPFMLYTIPPVTHHSVSIETSARLAKLPHVVGFKGSENSHRPTRSRARAPRPANFRPAQWRDLYAAARAGEWDRAERLPQQMIALAAVFQKNRSRGPWLAAMKAALLLRGLCSPAMLPPLQALDATATESLRSELIANGFGVGQAPRLHGPTLSRSRGHHRLHDRDAAGRPVDRPPADVDRNLLRREALDPALGFARNRPTPRSSSSASG